MTPYLLLDWSQSSFLSEFPLHDFQWLTYHSHFYREAPLELVWRLWKKLLPVFLSFICDNNEFRWFYCSCRRDWCPFQSRTIHVNQRQVVYMYLNTCYCLAFPPSRTSAWACSGQSWKRNPISMRWSSLFRDPVNAHCPGKKMPWLTAFWNQNRTRKFQDADCALFFSAAVLYISWYLVYIILSERCLQRC